MASGVNSGSVDLLRLTTAPYAVLITSEAVSLSNSYEQIEMTETLKSKDNLK